MTRPLRPKLFYGGLVVSKVLALLPTTGQVDVYLLVDTAYQWARVKIDRIEGRQQRPGKATRELTAAEVLAELRWRVSKYGEVEEKKA